MTPSLWDRCDDSTILFESSGHLSTPLSEQTVTFWVRGSARGRERVVGETWIIYFDGFQCVLQNILSSPENLQGNNPNYCTSIFTFLIAPREKPESHVTTRDFSRDDREQGSWGHTTNKIWQHISKYERLRLTLVERQGRIRHCPKPGSRRCKLTGLNCDGVEPRAVSCERRSSLFIGCRTSSLRLTGAHLSIFCLEREIMCWQHMGFFQRILIIASNKITLNVQELREGRNEPAPRKLSKISLKWNIEILKLHKIETALKRKHAGIPRWFKLKHISTIAHCSNKFASYEACYVSSSKSMR